MKNEREINYPIIKKFKKAMVATSLGLSLALGASSVPVLNPTMTTVEAATKKDKKKPKIKYKGKKKFTVVNDGSTFRINKAVTAKDNVDGNVTKKIKVKVKKGNTNVKGIAKITKKGKITLRNTKKLTVGNYSLYVEVKDKAGNKAKKKIATFTVVPEKKDYTETTTVVIPETTTEAPAIIESTEAEVSTTERPSEKELWEKLEKTTEASTQQSTTEKATENPNNTYEIDEKDVHYYNNRNSNNTTNNNETSSNNTKSVEEDSNNSYEIDDEDVHYHDNGNNTTQSDNNTKNNDETKYINVYYYAVYKRNDNNWEIIDPSYKSTKAMSTYQGELKYVLLKVEKVKEEEYEEDKMLGIYNNETYYVDEENKIYYYYQPIGVTTDGQTPPVQKIYVTHEDYNNISNDWQDAINTVSTEMFYLGEYNDKVYYRDPDNWIWYFETINTADGNSAPFQIKIPVTTYDYHEDGDDWKNSVKKYFGEIEISEIGYQKKYYI